MFTPYSGYYYGESLSVGKRVAMELKKAIQQNRLEETVT
jgi:5-formaminoimidazole-4-carboxamide-1-beta-D-ribofuranosyl 5'-monophosphate synthetase